MAANLDVSGFSFEQASGALRTLLQSRHNPDDDPETEGLSVADIDGLIENLSQLFPLHPRLSRFGGSHKTSPHEESPPPNSSNSDFKADQDDRLNSQEEMPADFSCDTMKSRKKHAQAADCPNSNTIPGNDVTDPNIACRGSVKMPSFLDVDSRNNSQTDLQESEVPVILPSARTLETGDSTIEQVVSDGREKNVVQTDSPVNTNAEPRSVSDRPLTEAHCRESSKTLHERDDKHIITISQTSQLLSSSPLLSNSSEAEDNQNSLKRQTRKYNPESYSLVSNTKQNTATPHPKCSDFPAPFNNGESSVSVQNANSLEHDSHMLASKLHSLHLQTSQDTMSRRLKEDPKKEDGHSPYTPDEVEFSLESTIGPEAFHKSARGWPVGAIPIEVFTSIANHLSREDTCNLRLVNREFALKLQDAMFRSIVVPFTASVFSPISRHGKGTEPHAEKMDLFKKLGNSIYKFGMSFELDEELLCRLPLKEKSEWRYDGQVPYRWHKSGYTRFDELDELEKLADRADIMKEAFSNLRNITELAVVINSSHGWLDGADISDNAVWRRESHPVFGSRSQPSEAREGLWNQYFENAQSNSISVMRDESVYASRKQKKYFQSISVASYSSFQDAENQPFPQHRQGIILPSKVRRPTEPELVGSLRRTYHRGGAVNQELKRELGQSADDLFHLYPLNSPSHLCRPIPNLGYRSPSFPLIFSEHNISADVGGSSKLLSARVSPPALYPLVPRRLTGPQTEWLRETAWAATAFMTSYICAIVDNNGLWTQVRSLKLSGISSGLLLGFDRTDFFEALPRLEVLTVLVIPDWHESDALVGEECPIVSISPEVAAARFTSFLRRRVAGMDRLKELTIGYIGGGEHATGMFARNQNILPAPIVEHPQPSVPGADKSVLTFGAILKITFQNCWFSPPMLKSFLKKSVALQEIVLDSCSLTALPGCTRTSPYRAPDLAPEYSSQLFYMEELRKGTWASILNKFTPGLTLEQKHVLAQPEEDLVAPERPESNLRRLELKSCGYVRLDDSSFNQNSLPVPDIRSMDCGLYTRFADLYNLMMDYGRGCPLLGCIVQCIGDDERHVLRLGFGMQFGWGDDMSRWGAVEDGSFEGGTGRFSGVLESDSMESIYGGEGCFMDTPPLERE